MSIVHVYGILSCWKDTAELETTFSVYRTLAVEKVDFEPFDIQQSFARSEHNNDKLSSFELSAKHRVYLIKDVACSSCLFS